MSGWTNKDLLHYKAKLLAQKRQLAYNDMAINIIFLICRDMEKKHGMEFVKRLLVITGLQDEVEIVQEE